MHFFTQNFTDDTKSLPSEMCINNIDNCFPDVWKESYRMFKSKLDAVDDEIEKRNK